MIDGGAVLTRDADDGGSKKAEALMEKHLVLWSTREDLDAPLTFVNLRKLPEIQ